MITPYEIESEILVLEGLLKGKEGKVKHYQKVYAEIDVNNNFIPNGDEIPEEHIPYISLNNNLTIEVKEDFLTIEINEFHKPSLLIPLLKKRYRFKEYLYNINIRKATETVILPHRIIHYRLNKKR